MNAMTLKIGEKYDVNAVLGRWLGWTKGDGTSADGYSVADYFGEDGAYLGPDCHGIEPTFRAD